MINTALTNRLGLGNIKEEVDTAGETLHPKPVLIEEAPGKSVEQQQLAKKVDGQQLGLASSQWCKEQAQDRKVSQLLTDGRPLVFLKL